jgi:PAS domain S-box-containing protein/diguanylate cyclase (GGDEF)-like protein
VPAGLDRHFREISDTGADRGWRYATAASAGNENWETRTGTAADKAFVDIRDMLADAELSLALFDQLREAMYVVDRERRIVFWNSAAERVTGYLSQHVVGRYCHNDILMHCDAQGQTLCGAGCPLARVVDDGKSHEMLIFLRHRHGHRIPVHVRAHAIHAAGGVVGAVEMFEPAPATFRDELRELEALGCLDPATHVLDRRAGRLRLQQQILEIGSYGGAAGWLRIALRDADSLSHRYGHAAPDAAMGLVARTLRGALPALDTVARWDAHEFRVLLSRCGTERLTETAELVRMLIRTSEFEWWGQPVHVDVAVDGMLAVVGDTAEMVEARLQRA